MTTTLPLTQLAEPASLPADAPAAASAQNPKVHERHAPMVERAQSGGCPFHKMLAAQDVSGLLTMADGIVRDKTFGDDTRARAQAVLEEALRLSPGDPDGEINGRLGRLAFLSERYGDAFQHLRIAHERNPSNATWTTLLERARVNVDTRIAQPLMARDQFDDSHAGKPPSLYIEAPRNLKGVPQADESWASHFFAPVRRICNAVAQALTDLSIYVTGGFAKATKPANGPWTTWYKRSTTVGALELGRDRQWTDGHLLRSTYDGATDAQAPQVKPAWTNRFRTANGSFNTTDPMEGAAGLEFQLQELEGTGKRVNRMDDTTLPSPREVSRVMLAARDGAERTAPHVNLIGVAWLQMMLHDWEDHGTNQTAGAYSIELAKDDPLRQTYGRDSISVPKTAANPTRPADSGLYRNRVTHWFDASEIYGSDQETQNRLRMGPDGKFLSGGKMRLDGDRLPINPETAIADAGFTRNWWGGLEILQTTFVKNHNWICDQLAKAYPQWDTDELFHTARLINAAMIAKIHTTELTPALSPNKTLARSLAINWWGAGEAVTKPIGKRREHNALDLGGQVFSGIIGSPSDNKGAPFGHSESFVEVYRVLHAAVPQMVNVRGIGADTTTPIATAELRAGNARHVEDAYGIDTLINSFGHQHMKALVANNYPAFMQDTSVDGSPVVDLGTIDIVRARERGVPPYNDVRRQVGLTPLKDFSELGCDAKTTESLRKLYGDNGIEKLDLVVGVLAESVRPTNLPFGETFFHITSQMANRRLEADPFYTDRFNADVYTKVGMQLIEQVRFKDVLMRAWPQLAKSGLANVNNPFEPWGTTAKTNPEEHPLTSKGIEKY